MVRDERFCLFCVRFIFYVRWQAIPSAVNGGRDHFTKKTLLNGLRNVPFRTMVQVSFYFKVGVQMILFVEFRYVEFLSMRVSNKKDVGELVGSNMYLE